MIKGRIAPATRMFELLKQPPAIFGYERRMAQRMRVEPVQQASTIEVLIFDGRLISTGSQWGHAAIDLDGKVYSQSHSRYAVLERSGYLSSNLEYRDIVGLTLRVSLAEKAKIKSELDSRVAAQKPYSLTDNSCSTNVAEVLEIAGILAHDPRFQMVPSSSRMVSPKELLIAISRSDRVLKATTTRRAVDEKRTAKGRDHGVAGNSGMQPVAEWAVGSDAKRRCSAEKRRSTDSGICPQRRGRLRARPAVEL